MPIMPADNKALPSLPSNHQYTSKPISLADGHEMLNSYCSTCTKSESCRMFELLCRAMGENFPYWPRHFKFVSASLEDEQGSNAQSFDERLTKPVCLGYRSPQRPLPRMPTQHTDAIYRVMELLAPEIAKRKAFVKQQDALWAAMALNHRHYCNRRTNGNASELQG